MRYGECFRHVKCLFRFVEPNDHNPGTPGPVAGVARVLCVDDNPDVASTTAQVLALFGFHTRSCCDGQTALRVAADFRPDACLLDLNMPGMDGYVLADRLRILIGRVVLIAVSAAYGERHDRRYATTTFDCYLSKPADPFQLASVLGQLRPPTGK